MPVITVTMQSSMHLQMKTFKMFGGF